MTEEEIIETAIQGHASTRDAIRWAIRQAQGEPVGKFAQFTDGIWREVTDGSAGIPLYTAHICTPPRGL